MTAFRGPLRYLPEQTKVQFSRQKEAEGNIPSNRLIINSNPNREDDIHTAMADAEEARYDASEDDINQETYIWLFTTMFVVAFVLVLLIALSIQLITKATQRSKQVI